MAGRLQAVWRTTCVLLVCLAAPLLAAPASQPDVKYDPNPDRSPTSQPDTKAKPPTPGVPKPPPAAKVPASPDLSPAACKKLDDLTLNKMLDEWKNTPQLKKVDLAKVNTITGGFNLPAGESFGEGIVTVEGITIQMRYERKEFKAGTGGQPMAVRLTAPLRLDDREYPADTVLRRSAVGKWSVVSAKPPTSQPGWM